MALIKCPECEKEISDKASLCIHCGYPLNSISESEVEDNVQEEEFTGIYRRSFWGGEEEVYCPKCNSSDCSHYKEQHIIAGKTKTRYTANLNPLRPFTVVNKKEKQVTPDRVVTDDKFMCNRCGYIFK